MAPQKSKDFCPKGYFHTALWDKGLFCSPRRTERIRNMAAENIPYKIYLSEEELPRTWYNVRADMKNKPAPPAEPRHRPTHGLRRPAAGFL